MSNQSIPAAQAASISANAPSSVSPWPKNSGAEPTPPKFPQPSAIRAPASPGSSPCISLAASRQVGITLAGACRLRYLAQQGITGLPLPGRAAHLALGGRWVMDKDLADQVVGIAARVVASGAISANGHGNVSVRVPGAEEMYFTAGPSLRNHPASAVVRVGLDGTLLEGELPPIQGAVVAMHTAMYDDNPDVGCVLHTHSPYATAYAVARRPIGCWIEALAMFGLQDGVPVAGYGPRGSAEAVASIRAAVTPGVPAVLLANHGVLVFHRTPELAILVGGVVEEAAQASINAVALGGPVEIPPDLRAAALQRAMTFDRQGTVRA